MEERVAELINQIGNSLDAPAHAGKILTESGKEILNIVRSYESEIKNLRTEVTQVFQYEDTEYAARAKNILTESNKEVLEVIHKLEQQQKELKELVQQIDSNEDSVFADERQLRNTLIEELLDTIRAF